MVQDELLRTRQSACYVYGVVPGGSLFVSDLVGLGEEPVYSISGSGISAVVAEYAGASFETTDASQLEQNLRRHQQVVQTLMERSSVVLPVRFGTLFAGESKAEVQAAVMSWLEAERSRFQSRMAEVTGHVEYGLKIFWQRRSAAERLMEQDGLLQSLQAEMAAVSRGTRFLLQRKFEQAVSRALEQLAEESFRDVWDALSRHSRRLEPEAIKAEKEDEWETLLQFSCLVEPPVIDAMERDLAAVAGRWRLRYRLSGPWPPYSFV